MTISTENQPILVRKILAWSVHLFTASGAFWGFLSILAIHNHNFKLAIFWMFVTVFVDGVDGTLSRLFKVNLYAPGLDGALLDNIIDYLNYVVVPALFMIEAGMLPARFALFAAAVILLSSAYQFCQVDAKTEDHYFKGFPSYWNVLAVYLLLLKWNPWINFIVITACGILVFVPLKYVYPSRTERNYTLTIGLTYLWGMLGVVMLVLYPNTPGWLVTASLLYIIYYVIISLLPQLAKG